MNSIDFEQFEALSEEEKKEASAKWSNDDWCEYYIKTGAVSIDDFFKELEDTAIKMANEKYGSNITCNEENNYD